MRVQDLPQPFQDRIARFNRLFQEGTEDHHDFEHDELFNYEMFCIESALGFAKLLPNIESFNAFLDKCKKEFNENPPERYSWESKNDYEKRINKGPDLYDVINKLCEEHPDNKIRYEEHSGNSIGASWILFRTYLFQPELVPYMHGSLSGLVGDKGYYDDRSDLPEIK